MAAVCDDHASGHVGTGPRSQQQKRPFELSQFTEASLRHAPDERLAGIAAEEFVVELGLEISGSKRVDANTVACPFNISPPAGNWIDTAGGVPPTSMPPISVFDGSMMPMCAAANWTGISSKKTGMGVAGGPWLSASGNAGVKKRVNRTVPMPLVTRTW